MTELLPHTIYLPILPIYSYRIIKGKRLQAKNYDPLSIIVIKFPYQHNAGTFSIISINIIYISA